jgi:hypothetical protein
MSTFLADAMSFDWKSAATILIVAPALTLACLAAVQMDRANYRANQVEQALRRNRRR